MKGIEELKKSQRETRGDVQEVCGISKDIRSDVNKIHQRIKDIEQSVERHERKERANNIIIFGMNDDDDTELLTTIISLFRSVNLDLPEVAIADVFKLGKKINRFEMGKACFLKAF